MRYKISFKDLKKPQMIVKEETGRALMALRAQENSPEYIEIQGGQYPLTSIRDIEPVQDLVPPTNRIEYKKDTCRGEHSIHAAINIAFKKRKDQSLTYDEFAEKAYSYFYEQKQEWCDYKKNTCYCDSNHKPVFQKSEALMDVEKTFGSNIELLA